jgi:hypothetical protein
MHEFRARGDASVGREQISLSTTNRRRRGRFTCFNIVGRLKLAPLGLAGISGVTGAREDGGDLSYSSSKIVKFNCSSSRSSSSKQSSTINPSRGGELLSTGDLSTSLSVLVPVPLNEMTTGGGVDL